MPLKVLAGVSRKVGLPNYSSLGATCELELELESGLFERDLESLQRRVQDAYLACTQAVDEELARQLEARRGANGRAAAPAPVSHRDDGAGENPRRSTTDGSRAADGNGEAGQEPHEQPASARQIEFLRLLAGQIRGLGVRRLEAFSDAVAGKPLAALSAPEASRLIDGLKQVRGGAIELAALWEGAER